MNGWTDRWVNLSELIAILLIYLHPLFDLIFIYFSRVSKITPVQHEQRVTLFSFWALTSNTTFLRLKQGCKSDKYYSPRHQQLKLFFADGPTYRLCLSGRPQHIVVVAVGHVSLKGIVLE